MAAAVVVVLHSTAAAAAHEKVDTTLKVLLGRGHLRSWPLLFSYHLLPRGLSQLTDWGVGVRNELILMNIRKSCIAQRIASWTWDVTHERALSPADLFGGKAPVGALIGLLERIS